MKKCSICGKSGDKNIFYKKQSGKDGLSSMCKQCAVEKSRNYYSKHRENINQKRRKIASENHDLTMQLFRERRIAKKVKVKGSKKFVRCSLCKEWKNEKYFYKTKSDSGFSSWCKQCSRARSNKYREDNRDIYRERNRNYRKNNPKKCKQKDKEYYEKHKDVISEKNKIFYKKNKKKIDRRNREYTRKYYDENKEIINKKAAIYRENNREYLRSRRRELYKTKDRSKRNERRKKSPYYLKELARSALRNYIKCPPKELVELKRQHILLLRRIKNIKQEARK